MTVFISWSGERSKAVAHVFKRHLEYVIQGIPTFMSDKDIASGTQWFQEINDKLRDASFGIVCATPENVEKPWLRFELGALGNQASKSRVVPVVYGMSKENLPSPLNGFNAVDLDEDGFVRLIESICESLSVSTSWEIIETAARREWPEIEVEVSVIPKPTSAADIAPSFDLEGAIKEMRGLLREIVNREDNPQQFAGPDPRRLNDRSYLGPSAKAGRDSFGTPTEGLLRTVEKLLYGYLQGDEAAGLELQRLGLDPDKRSPVLDAAVASRNAAIRRAANSVGHDDATSD